MPNVLRYSWSDNAIFSYARLYVVSFHLFNNPLYWLFCIRRSSVIVVELRSRLKARWIIRLDQLLYMDIRILLLRWLLINLIQKSLLLPCAYNYTAIYYIYSDVTLCFCLWLTGNEKWIYCNGYSLPIMRCVMYQLPVICMWPPENTNLN